jgi:hypothetical protein
MAVSRSGPELYSEADEKQPLYIALAVLESLSFFEKQGTRKAR